MPDTRLSPTAGTTEAALVRNVARLLGDRPWTEKHTNDPPNPATSLTVASDATTRWEVGDWGDWFEDATYDTFLVTAVAATALTVEAGYLPGSSAADHAANARIRKRPRFPGIDVQKAVNDAIAGDLYPHLYAVYETQVAYTPTTADWYEVDAAAEKILTAYQKPDTGNVDLLGVRVTQPTYTDAVLASTHKKAFKVLAAPDDNNTIFVQYIRKPALGDLSDAMARIVEYGACWRLLEWEGAARSSTEDVRASGATQPGQTIRDARWFRSQQEELRRTERAVLRDRFPNQPRRYRRGLHL